MLIEIVNGKPYYWLNYTKLRANIPIININSNDVLRRRLKKLENCEILEHFTKKSGGTYSYYAVGKNYKILLSESTTQKSDSDTFKSEGSDSKVGGGTTQKSEQKINLLKNINLLNINNIYSLVIDYLNKSCDKKYKANTDKTKSLINARLNEGFTKEDFLKVIDTKCLDWIGTDSEKYLRPETLFGNKFEGYLNQPIKKVNNHGDGGHSKENNNGKEEYDFSRFYQ